MKLLREYIRELLLTEDSTEAVENRQPGKFTVGYVVDSIKALKAIEEEQDAKVKDQKEKDYAEKKMWAGAKLFAGLFPGGSTVVKLAKIARDVTKKNIPDAESSKDPILMALDIDDQYSAMLDDELQEEFINKALAELEALDRDSPLPDMDKALEAFVQKRHKRSIDGAQIANESIVREYIRILLEFEAGEKLWPIHAMDGSRHKGPPSHKGGEKDTKQERELRDMLLNHLENGTEDTGDRLSSRAMSQLKRAALDDRYSDVVTYYQGPVYRGIAVGTDWMDNHLPEDWRDMKEFYPRAKSNPPVKVNINYETRIGGNVESWSKNPKEAEGFALENMDSDYYVYGVVLKSEASGNQFVDLHRLITQYEPSLFDPVYFSEQEVITNQSTIPVTEMQIISFAKDYHDGY